jgi:Mg-chelatase subunit ChlD
MQRLLSTAAKSLPRETGETKRVADRLHRPGRVAILADTSGSMADRAGTRTKTELLAEAVAGVWRSLDQPRLISFNSGAHDVPGPEALPAPSGGTALHLALRYLCDPAEERTARLIVISDGQPEDETAALRAADELNCRIDVIYCGPESDSKAVDFMRRLARLGCGECVVVDVVRAAGGPALIAAVKRLALTSEVL